ncbi:MAG: hypothetical protein AMXMBFR64_41000 [Myxococcales bacterium]
MLLVSSMACGVAAPAGLDEPIRIRGGVFKSGELPGAPVPEETGSASSEDEATEEPKEPTVTSFGAVSNLIRPGQVGRNIAGRTSPDALSVGLRFADLGTGYWVAKVQGVDPTANGERVWQVQADFGYDIPVGLQKLQVVAFDEGGKAGQQRETDVCVLPDYPDNFNSCDPTIPPPALVVSLQWDQDMDLDLRLTSPGGKVVSPKNPTTATAVDNQVPADALADPTTGRFDLDSNANCVVDGARRENLVWQEDPPKGSWLVHVDPYAACGEPATRFRLSVLRREPGDEEGTWRQVETVIREGQLLAASATGGAKPPLYVTALTLP